MPFEREPIFHDRQIVFSLDDQTTTSSSFVDVTDAVLTTGDLGSEAVYSMWWSLVVSVSSANTIASFRLLVNGVAQITLGRPLLIKTNTQDVEVTFLNLVHDLVDGDVLQLQMATDKGTLTLSEFDFMIDGIPEIRNLDIGIATTDTLLLESGFNLLKEDSAFHLNENQVGIQTF